MRSKLAIIALRWAVGYLNRHPNAIPGHIDDTVIPWLARILGV